MSLDKPWEDEPDFEEWEVDGYMCEIRRSKGGGHLCGYLLLPKGHLWAGKDFNSIEAEVHGGLTFARTDDKTGRWRIGFDCSHLDDVTPYYAHMCDYPGRTYKDIFYVRRQVYALFGQARQLEGEQ